MKKKQIIGLTVLILCTIFTGYFYSKYMVNSDNIRIAVVGPMSGKSAVNGEAFLQGIQLCLQNMQRHNSSNNIPPIVIDIFDDQNKADKAYLAAKKIANQKRHVAVIGHNYSSCSIRAGKIYKEIGIPAISPASTNIMVTRNNRWFFRTIFNDYLQSIYLAIYVKEVLEKKNISIIQEDLSYGSYLGKVFEEECRSSGLSIAFKMTFKVNAPDRDKRIEQIVNDLKRHDQTDVIFLAMHASEGVKFVKAIKDNNIDIPIITPDAFASKTFQKGFEQFPEETESPGYYTNGIYVITPIIYDTANEDAQHFWNQFIQQYGKEPGWHAAFAYDTAKVLFHSINRCIDPGDRKPISEERKALRDELSSISSIDKSIKGVTGYNYYDINGDSPKPVSIGIFKNGKIVSAMHQLQVTGKIQKQSKEPQEDQIMFDNQVLTKTRVVYTGIKINELSDINMNKLLFSIDCYLWFRFRGELDTENIVFNNAAMPIILKKLSEQVSDDGVNYHLYHLMGRFKADSFSYKLPFGKHLLGIAFHHKKHHRNHLIYVVDMIGMGMNDQVTLLSQINSPNVLNPSYGWCADQVNFFQSVCEESALGVPEYIDINSGVIKYSQFNLGVRIKRSKFGVNLLYEIFPVGFTIKALIISLLVVFCLAVMIRKRIVFQTYSNFVWVVQASFVFVALLTCEIFMLNNLVDMTSMENVRVFKRLFDILWWLIPAFCLNLAIKRFIWTPLENKTQRKIPTVARRFVAFIIILLSLFGIIAFVFDERITGMLATSGVFAMIIGLAVQMNISNIFSGIALNVERTFRTGDWIRIGELKEGEVLDVNWRCTRIQCRDNSIHNIPNSMVSDSEITNYSYPNQIFEHHFIIHIDPFHAPDRVKKIILDALLSIKEINQDPAPFVRFKGTTEFSTKYAVFYCSDNYSLKTLLEEVVWNRVFIHLKRAKIQLAMQRHRIYMSTDVPIEADENARSTNLLKDIELFKHFSEKDQTFISQRIKHHHFRASQTIVRQGDDGDSLYIIVEGVVSITIHMEGREIELNRLGAENIFGEMALLTGEPRSANVISLTDTYLLEISKRDIAPIIEAQPEISTLLGEVLLQRKQKTQSILNQADPTQVQDEEIPKRIVSKILNYFGVKIRNE